MSTSSLRWQRAIGLVVAVIMVLALVGPGMANAASNSAKTAAPSIPGQVLNATRVGQSQGALRDIPVRAMGAVVDNTMIGGDAPIKKPLDLPYPRKVTNPNAKGPAPAANAPAAEAVAPQSTRPNQPPLKKLPDEVLSGLYASWNGLNQGGNRTLFGFGFVPPDTNGDTSGDVYTYGYYVETVNVMIAVWDYSQSNLYGAWPKTVLGPIPINTLWTGFGGACEYTNDGDPIVLYDEQADRWLVTQFALPVFSYGPGAFPYDMYECVAVSQTGDPTGAYWLYEFPAPITGLDSDNDPTTAMDPGSKMPDYPKFGIWQDGYYMTVNQFDVYTSLSAWAGAGVYVFDRTSMLSGSGGSYFYFDPFAAFNCSMGTYYTTESNPWCFMGGMLPADNDGAWAPAGTPAYLVEFQDDAWSTPAFTVADQLDLFSVAPNWSTLVATMTWVSSLPVNAFDSEVCAGYARNCIKQPGTAQGVDAISDRLMARLQYRNFGGASGQSMVVNHTVDMNDPAGHAGIRWYELHDSGAGWVVKQQGDFSPNASSRWMGSAAMDVQGNIALGYSVSDAVSVYPSIRYTGWRTIDLLGAMGAEKALWTGGGSQTTSAARWGDYSSMSVASGTGCDFVYAQQYLRGTTPAEWYTGIGNFGFGECWSFVSIFPETTITVNPADPTYVDSATFEFTGATNGGADLAGFDCALDAGSWFDCSSPYIFTGLSAGTHTFYVRAVNMIGNADASPASWTWTVIDNIAPDTSITDTGTAGPGSTTAEFTFSGTDDFAVASFECSLDGSVFATCTSPKSYTGLANGAHTFQVRAFDSSGNYDLTPASYSWTINIGSATFVSQAANDGFVIETTETSGIGGVAKATDGIFAVGDYAGNRQVKGFLSFDTSALPNGAVVTGARIEMRYQGVIGTNPYTTHGPLRVDIASPYFGAGAGLLASDFQAAFGASNVAYCGPIPSAFWYSCDMEGAFGFVSVTGTTQFRLWFDWQDNNDGSADLVKFFSGNVPYAPYRPVLVVDYYIP